MSKKMTMTVADMLMAAPSAPVDGPIEMPINIAPSASWNGSLEEPRQSPFVQMRPIECPADVAPYHSPDTVWFEWRTSHGYAQVGIIDLTSKFVLHWIESSEPGHGSAILRAIHEYADQHGLEGKLAVALASVPWYQRHGWIMTGPFVGLYEMRRPR